MTVATGPVEVDQGALPPVAQLGITALILVVASGIYLAAGAGRRLNVVPAVVALSLAVLVVAAAAILLGRVKQFAWSKFRMVCGWALLEYAVIAGILVYVFSLDHIPTSTLTLLILSLVIFAVDIPMMFGFAVARYQPASP
jgi:hypothetical protein